MLFVNSLAKAVGEKQGDTLPETNNKSHKPKKWMVFLKTNVFLLGWWFQPSFIPVREAFFGWESRENGLNSGDCLEDSSQLLSG